MHVINATNVNDALPKMLVLIDTYGIPRTSRAGQVLEVTEPVTTIYRHPLQRVLFSPARDANPFFHLMEALWMLGGRDDIEYITFYNKRMISFSDDGVTQRGAYGYRWLQYFGGNDQLACVIDLLKGYPHSRRAVIGMWDPQEDLSDGEYFKDVPCNLVIHCQLTDKEPRELNITVFCRSNDIIWGAAGANAVHFSILQEYLASMIGVRVGKMYQISNNFHAYTNVLEPIIVKGVMTEKRDSVDRYYPSKDGKPTKVVSPSQLVVVPDEFDRDLHMFFEYQEDMAKLVSAEDLLKNLSGLGKWSNPFFIEIALPMTAAYQIFRRGDDRYRYDEMKRVLVRALSRNESSDWLTAAFDWTERKRVAYLERKGETTDE